ncbi:hypothetical protein AB0A71_07015 [Kitasatospora aureofaciens]|uniref:hypothetical protein n=1 Tax=Kitasatospora aureofaciens TaxID=1894 RepID=UPI00340637CC
MLSGGRRWCRPVRCRPCAPQWRAAGFATRRGASTMTGDAPGPVDPGDTARRRRSRLLERPLTLRRAASSLMSAAAGPAQSRQRRGRPRVGVAAAVCALLTGATVLPATAAPVAARHTGSVRAAVSRTFTFTGHPETYTVPAGAVVAITADGAGGGDLTNCPLLFAHPWDQPGGTGGRVKTTLVTTAPTTYTVNVGGAGGQDCGGSAAGGYNGGGDGGYSTYNPNNHGAGGGGASTISADGALLAVAGGGGGAGEGSASLTPPSVPSGGRGGNGGLNADNGGQGFAVAGGAGGGGQGGSTTTQSPGTGGTGGSTGGFGCLGHSGLAGGSFSGAAVGSGGAGGQGEPVHTNCLGGDGGGGGGGGYFGGGGGGASAVAWFHVTQPDDYVFVYAAAGGGGGGGSSFATPSGAGTSYTTSPIGTAKNNGQVTISVLSAITATAGTPQSTPINTNFPALFRATVTDTSGDPVPGVRVTFTAPSTGPSGSFLPLPPPVPPLLTFTATTDDHGVATASTFYANGTAGSYTVTASLPDAPSIPPASFALTNLPSPTGPYVTIGKSHAGNFTQGQQGTYTIAVGNAGRSATDGSTVIVHDALPSGLTAAGISGTGWSCDVSTVTCTRSDVLPAGRHYPDITLTVNVSPTAPAQVTNTVTVTGGGDTTTPHTATDPTTINPAPTLTISKHHAGNFIQGQQGTYTITVGNTGTGPTNGSPVIANDLLPTGLTAAGISGTGWSCDVSTVTCTRSDVLPAGQNYPDITLTVDVSPSAPQVTNTVTVTGGGDTATHTATDPTTINPTPPTLTISKHHAGNFTQGQQGTYTITVGNTGTGPTNGGPVIANDLLPAGLTAASISGPGWTCDLGTVSCFRSDVLPAGQNYPDITLTVNVSPTAPAQVINTAVA